ncbi:MAG: hypothetical protein AB7L92_06120 [Alphaproteobacteria bacterium]
MNHEHTENDHHVSRWLAGLAIGAVAVGAAIVVAPHILPELGIGSAETFEDAMWVSHGFVASPVNELGIREAGSGLAGVLNRAMASYVPFIGEKLAEGGLFNAIVAGSTGLGGYLLGGFIADHEDGSKSIKWGNVIKYAALSASALIALPTLLSGLTMGLTYLAMLTENNPLIETTVDSLNQTLGVSGGKMSAGFLGLSGMAAVVPHLFTCGMAFLPAALGLRDATRSNSSPRMSERDPITADIITDSIPAAGKDVVATLSLKHADGTPLREEELATMHTSKMHVMLTDSTLQDYHHIHPKAGDAPGTWNFSFTPHTSNNYSLWADITTQADNRNHHVKIALAAIKKNPAPPLVRSNDTYSTGDLAFAWSTREPLQQGQASVIQIKVTDTQGIPVNTLEPVMGAYAHLIGFSADGKSLVHCHPLGKEPENSTDRGSGNLLFHIMPQASGPVQFYLQVKHKGKTVIAPFGQQVQQPEKFTERLQQPAMHGPSLQH